MAQRKELAAFVRSRRERLTPADAGLPAGPRRRTPGLRREEVAQLCGVSVTWYTWLEQGRKIRMSRQVLRSIAGALQMSPEEQHHMLTLAEVPVPQESPVTAPHPLLQRMVSELDPNPAYVLSPCWDLLCWNRAEAGLIGDPEQLPPAERNILWLLFTNPAMRHLLVDWQSEAQRLLAQYRVAAAERTDEPRFAQLTAALHEASSDFRQWWKRHDIATFQPARKHFRHPRVGGLTVDYAKLLPAENSDVRIVVYLPADASTQERLPQLVKLAGERSAEQDAAGVPRRGGTPAGGGLVVSRGRWSTPS